MRETKAERKKKQIKTKATKKQDYKFGIDDNGSNDSNDNNNNNNKNKK